MSLRAGSTSDMTLAKGNHVVKLDSNGEPLMDPQRESYVEFEVVDLSPTFSEWKSPGDPASAGETMQFAKLRKVR